MDVVTQYFTKLPSKVFKNQFLVLLVLPSNQEQKCNSTVNNNISHIMCRKEAILMSKCIIVTHKTKKHVIEAEYRKNMFFTLLPSYRMRSNS